MDCKGESDFLSDFYDLTVVSKLYLVISVLWCFFLCYINSRVVSLRKKKISFFVDCTKDT